MTLHGYIDTLKDTIDEDYLILLSDHQNCSSIYSYNVVSAKVTLFLNDRREFCGLKVKLDNISYKLSYIEVIDESGEKIDLGTLVSSFI